MREKLLIFLGVFLIGGQDIFTLSMCLLEVPVRSLAAFMLFLCSVFIIVMRSSLPLMLLVKLVLEVRSNRKSSRCASIVRLCSKLMFVGFILASTNSLDKLVRVFLVKWIKQMTINFSILICSLRVSSMEIDTQWVCPHWRCSYSFLLVSCVPRKFFIPYT